MSDTVKTLRQIVEKEVVVAKKCDICGKPIEPSPAPPLSYGDKCVPFFEISTGHYDWGRDSRDSMKEYHACCPNCLMKFVDEYVRKDFDKIHTKYIEIEHVSAWHLAKEAPSGNVRCRDCKYYDQDGWCNSLMIDVNGPDWFCASGEAKD